MAQDVGPPGVLRALGALAVGGFLVAVAFLILATGRPYVIAQGLQSLQIPVASPLAPQTGTGGAKGAKGAKKSCKARGPFDFDWHDDVESLSHFLVAAERKFSPGVVKNIPCARGIAGKGTSLTCMGSDRMATVHHQYSVCYARQLHALRSQLSSAPPFTPLVAEVGILQGSGLAIWSHLFSCNAQIHGFDLDLSNIQGNMAFLTSRGAFTKANLQLHELNQSNNNVALVGQAAGFAMKFTFVVDDGYHTPNTLLQTFESFRPHLAPRFLYVMEDIKPEDMEYVRSRLETTYDVHRCEADERFLAVTPKTR